MYVACALSVVILSVLIVSSHSQFLKQCQDLPIQQGFNMTRFLGEWYDIAHFDNVVTAFERNRECIKSTFAVNSKLNHGHSGHYIMTNKLRKPAKTYEEMRADLYAIDVSKPARLTLTFGGPSAGIPSQYNIIETDYSTYALVYSCISPIGLYKFESPWILMRSPKYTQVDLDTILAKWRAHGIDTSKFKYTSQESCKY